MVPIVTVVTLSYKNFKYIYDAINSVLSQDYEKIEYIIADDGSDQFPRNEIEQYIKKNAKQNIVNFQILEAGKNRGTVKNIANAYDHASGDYLFPLSADDAFINNGIISNLVNVFETSGANILCASRLVIDAEQMPVGYLPHRGNLKRIHSLNTAEKQFRALIGSKANDMASGCAMYLRRSFYRGHRFDDTFFLWEDGPYLTKCTKEGEKIIFCHDIVAIFYRLGGISTTAIAPNMQKDLEKYSAMYLRTSPTYSRYVNRRIAWREYQIRTQKNFSVALLLKYPMISLERGMERIRDFCYGYVERRELKKKYEKMETERRI